MKRIVLLTVIITGLVSCKEKTTGKKDFEVKGKITNNSARMIYLEQLPMAAQQATVIDSAKLGKDGTYSLGSETAESSIYNLRLDQSAYPFASVINDVKQITVNVSFSKDNKEFPEKYDVKGSEASIAMKNFMFDFNKKLQDIYYRYELIDSLKKEGRTDSVVTNLSREKTQISESAKKLLDSSLQASKNPALTLFILGYYQSNANIPQYELAGLPEAEVKKLIEDLAAKFPEHVRLAQIKRSLNPEGWVGKSAPEIALPDANGNEVKLSSFRGNMYSLIFGQAGVVLARQENPNVVMAYNKYKNKNFAILGVSLDRPGQKDKWLAAVMKDNLTWTQVSDLLEWNSPVVALYNFGEEGIPYNILVDPQGKIIAERLRGEELDKKLAEVLK